MNVVAAVFILFVGAAVTAPQGPAQYQQFRPAVKPNYPYRPQQSPVPIVESQPTPLQTIDSRLSQVPKPQPYSIIVKQSQEDNFDGSFNYNFEADNGIAVQGAGYLKDAGTENEAQVIQGSYSYTSPDGTPIVTNWYADETGFHAEGAHLPVPPPLPEAIAKLVAFHRSLPQTEERSQQGKE